MVIRNANLGDVNIISDIEAKSFPEEEAASFEKIQDRLIHFKTHFWLLEENGIVKSYIDGFVTNEKDLTDEMYDNASMHDEDGKWQMIFTVATLPDYRKKGYASIVMNRVIEDCKQQNRKGIVLTCKDRLIPFYSKFGFKNEGVSESVHGGAIWYQMRLTF